jgi:hypothetical protein
LVSKEVRRQVGTGLSHKGKRAFFYQAVENILGYTTVKEPVFYRSKEKKPASLLIPKLSESTQNVERYLESRGIHRIIIRYCIEHKLLFESENYHNAGFIGVPTAVDAQKHERL